MALLTDMYAGPRIDARHPGSTSRLRRAAGRTAVRLPDGAELIIRPAVGDDADEVRWMHARSSAETRQRRYLSGILAPPDAKLRRLLEPPGGITLLAVHFDPYAGTDEVVAMANLLAEGDTGEVAFLVEDTWQRRGLGLILLRRLLAYARWAGFTALVAHTATGNTPMLRTLRRVSSAPAVHDGPMITITIPITNERHHRDHINPSY
jgi:RimJ/RimL family protein N-acetyltransferase